MLCSAYWMISVALLVAKLANKNAAQLTLALVMFNSVMLINFVLADGVVVWRMYVICSESTCLPQKVLILPLLLLGITVLSVLVTITLRVVATVVVTLGHTLANTPLLNTFTKAQTMSVCLSLATNVAATVIIGICAW
ncbi:hypothetical protein BC835DRAFT_1100541 [Cytidiella melzeri]|nr:hypothetical protein BC835DRAFT_1100541 [Cytidiella melzeri]